VLVASVVATLRSSPGIQWGSLKNMYVMATVYEINKGINRSIEFKGIKAQYIIYLAAGLVLLLLIFAILYMIGISIYLCLGIVIPAGAGLFLAVKHYSNTYGEHGLIKKAAQRNLPSCIQSRSRKFFNQLRETDNEKDKNTGKAPAGL
jgi:hypothetical protein